MGGSSIGGKQRFGTATLGGSVAAAVAVEVAAGSRLGAVGGGSF